MAGTWVLSAFMPHLTSHQHHPQRVACMMTHPVVFAQHYLHHRAVLGGHHIKKTAVETVSLGIALNHVFISQHFCGQQLHHIHRSHSSHQHSHRNGIGAAHMYGLVLGSVAGLTRRGHPGGKRIDISNILLGHLQEIHGVHPYIDIRMGLYLIVLAVPHHGHLHGHRAEMFRRHTERCGICRQGIIRPRRTEPEVGASRGPNIISVVGVIL